MNPFDMYSDEEFNNLDSGQVFQSEDESRPDVSKFEVIGAEAALESLLLKEERVSLQILVDVMRRHQPLIKRGKANGTKKTSY
jgi:hypothetical protein